MKVSEIKIGETYNGVKVLEKFHEKGHTKYWYICPVCGERFSMKAETVGKACRCKKCNAKARIIDLTGKRFGRLVAVEYVGCKRTASNKWSMWRCKCDCGKETIVRYIHLVKGNTQSCGCLGDEARHNNNRVRRKSVSQEFGFEGNLDNHPLRRIWKSMLMRCNNPNVQGYKHYGGRGIKVCDRWQGELGFENFVADMGVRPNGTTLDRIDYNGDYEPTNCRWATNEQQSNNRTDNSRIVLNGETITCAQLCKRYGFYRIYVTHLIHDGVDVNEVIRRALRPKGERKGKRGDLAKCRNHNRVVSDEVMKMLEERSAI